MLYIWFRPHGSNRDGIRNRSDASFDQMRQRFVEADPRADPIGVPRGDRAPHVLVARLAGAEHDERGIELDQILEGRGDQVEAFLIDHPRHHPDERPRHRRLVGRQAVAPEHRRLGVALAGQIAGVERRGQERIARRIPFVGVDAVQNADQVRGAGAQDAVEPEAERRRLNLLGVAPADGRDRPRVVDAALQEADAAVELEAIDRRTDPSRDRDAAASPARRCPDRRGCGW